MTEPEFQTWVEHHGTLFMMTGQADEALFRAWKPLVLPYVLSDFIEGSNYIATNVATAFRTTHLALIRQRISARRLEQIALERAGNDGIADYSCSLCFGAAVVFVPHVDHVHDGEWLHPWPLMAIACQCSKGRRRFDVLFQSYQDGKIGKDFRPLDWSKYEGRVPNWAGLMEDRQKRYASEAVAKAHAAHADKVSPLSLAVAAIKRMPPRPKQLVDLDKIEAMRAAKP